MTVRIDASAPAPPCALLDGRRGEIVAVARRILEAEGPAALTMRRVGAELSIQAPSLYKHLRGKGGHRSGSGGTSLPRGGAGVARCGARAAAR